MKIGSLFSGGGGGDLGFKRSGHEIVFGCEIDAKARSVFRFHHPDIPIYHDIAEVTRERLATDGIEPPDLIMGGSPCQDLSVAGLRAGLDGKRSGLFHQQCRVADELAAPWVCWENVAGAFSSNHGADFATVLGGLTGYTPAVPARGWRTGGVCVGPKRVAVWRVLDAQNFGVPQRRRRVFVVAGPRTMARRVVEVLFEPESSERDSKTSNKSGEEIAAETDGRVATASGGGLTDIAQTIQHKYPRNDLETDSFILETAEPIQSIINGQEAYSGQYVLGTPNTQLTMSAGRQLGEIAQPILRYYGQGSDLDTQSWVVERINEWAESAQQENIAAPLLHGTGGPRTTDIDGGTWVISAPSTPSPDSLELVDPTTTTPKPDGSSNRKPNE